MARAPRDVAQVAPKPSAVYTEQRSSRNLIEEIATLKLDYQSCGFSFLTGFFVIGPRFYRAATRHRTT